MGRTLLDVFRRGEHQTVHEGLENRYARKIRKSGINPEDLSPAQREGASAELRFRDAMRNFKESNVRFGKSKSKKYLRAYWKNRAIQEVLAKQCFNEIEAQIMEIEHSIPQSALEDPEVRAYLQEAIKELRSLERKLR